MLRHIQLFCASNGLRDVGQGSLKSYATRIDAEILRRADAGEADRTFTPAQRMAMLNPPRAARQYCKTTRRGHDRTLLASGHWEKVGRNLYAWHRRPLLGPPAKLCRSIMQISRPKSPADAESTISTIYAAGKACAPPGMSSAEIDAIEAEWMQPKPSPPPKPPSPVGPCTASPPKAASQKPIPPSSDVQATRAYLAALFEAEQRAKPRETPPKKPAHKPKQSAPKAAAPKKQATPPNPALPDDHVTGDATWQRDVASRCKHIAPLNLVSRWGRCYPRWVWRAAFGGLAARAPGTVRHPARYVASLAKQIAEGAPDPRRQPGYFALGGWGPVLLGLANVGAPL